MVSKALAESWTGIIEYYGDMASTLAADLVEEQLDKWGMQARTDMVPGVDPKRATARLGWANSQPDKLGNMLVLLDELVKQPYRSTLQDSAIKSGAGWARVPTGAETCEFCILLASRGAVYSSKRVTIYGFSGKRYHGDCDCTPALVRGPEDYPRGYNPDDLYDRYDAATSAAGRNDVKDILAQMRRDAQASG
ncbi:hypothetical protein [Propionimicrobium sp. PCR01-08-3]|uniref:VG15 protein n=1 Tax=Propionimicrobium sp. PCR01-08-3 TaxID=3052086 RepID=UPI00255CE967|nr:hypothetical protein [Propionimicrobium sp. PCR01-08-3]WIY84324.1 hypothetical protein QQ658_15295 [Propionimicrobium sp. PCR01-08-3]